MVKLRNIILKVLPMLKQLEETPTATVIRVSSYKSYTPFDSNNTTENYDEKYDVPVIYAEQPEIVTSGNNITTQKVMYIYIHQKDLPQNFGDFRMDDRIIFRKIRYKPIGIRNLFGLWEVRVQKE